MVSTKKADKKDNIRKDSPFDVPILDISADLEDWNRNIDFSNRRLFLYGEISDFDDDNRAVYCSTASKLVEQIFKYNRMDMGKPLEERVPIRLYINSPGGDLVEGFSIISAIKLSKTPVYTINVGQWSSVAFLIGITGKKRFSLPNMTFLLHDGHTYASGSFKKVQDATDFLKRFAKEVIKPHVLEHSKMKASVYAKRERAEQYMLPGDAIKYGFIDEIVTDLDDIL